MPEAKDEPVESSIPAFGKEPSVPRATGPTVPPAAPIPPAGKVQNDEREAQPGLLAEMLYLDERYPVLLAGSATSGKSTVIISLIYAATRAGKQGTTVDVALGQSFFRKANELGEAVKVRDMQDFADRFFQNARSDFVLARKELAATQPNFPVVIPLDLTFRDTGTVVKIAVIDGKGEWYEPIVGEDEKRHRQLHADIENLIGQYEPGMSFVWVAPVVDERGKAQLADQGLEAALSRYQEHRRLVSARHDSHIYLLTKWDAHSSYDTGEHFERVDGGTVADYNDQHYQLSWSKYQSLPLGPEDSERRKFMQYCSWRFQNAKPVPLSVKQESAFLRYPRTLLNWIVSHAVRVEGRREGRLEGVLRFIPFPDVMPANTVYVPLSKRIIRMLT